MRVADQSLTGIEDDIVVYGRIEEAPADRLANQALKFLADEMGRDIESEPPDLISITARASAGSRLSRSHSERETGRELCEVSFQA